MSKFSITLVVLAVLPVAAACGDDDRPPPPGDGGRDAGPPPSDGGRDGGPPDGGDLDGGDLDGGDLDAGALDAGAPDAGDLDAGPSASAMIAAARATADGASDVALAGVLVSYLKPMVGTEGPGFFVQAERGGPALYVNVDPASLSPAAEVGDEVAFRITEMGTNEGLRQAVAIADFARASAGHDTAALVQDVSSAADLVSALGDYESELITLSATVTAGFVGAGTDHEAAVVDTAGVMGDAGLRVRLPVALRSAYDLATGCVLELTGPMWRFRDTAQPSAYAAADLMITSCPAPRLTAAAASSPTEVVVTFDREIDAASVLADGSQFTITGAGGLAVSAAAHAGRVVTLTTAAQTSGGAYTVTVDATVTDLIGTAVDAGARSAGFTGYVVPLSTVIINEVDYDQVGADNAEFVELYNPGASSVSLVGVELRFVNGSSGATYLTVALDASASTLGAGAYLVVAATGVTVAAGADVLRFASATDNIQNGAPDAVVVVDRLAGTVLDALSYEGAMTGITLADVAGAVSLVEGTMTSAADSNSAAGSLARIPNGSDTDDAATDWLFVATPTPGAANM